MNKKQAKYMANFTTEEEWTLFNKWYNIAVKIFKWDNLPDGINSNDIEKLLFNGGKAVFINDPDIGYLVLDAALNGKFNYNHNPIKWRAVGLGYNKPFDIDNSVLIQNMLTMTPTFLYIESQIKKMVNIEATHDLNLNAQKTPYFFSGSEDELLTFKNIVDKIIGANEVAVYLNKGIGEKAFTLHKPDVPFIANDLHDDYNIYENRIKEYLGLDAISVDKKERLLKGEGDANDEHINANLSVFLDARLDAAKAINKMFNLEIEVHINPLIFDTAEEEANQEEQAGGDNNG